MRKERLYHAGTACQRAVCSVVLTCLYRALRGLERCDSRVRREMAGWPEGFCVSMELPGGPALRLQHTSQKGLCRAPQTAVPDVTIRFKSVRDALYLCSGQTGVAGARRSLPTRCLPFGPIGRS